LNLSLYLTILDLIPIKELYNIDILRNEYQNIIVIIMENVNIKQKVALIGAVLYTIIIGIGMYISFHINGVFYGTAEMVNTLWYIEIVLTILTIFITVKYFSWKEVGFVKLQTKQMLWFVPSIIVLGYMCFLAFSLSIENGLSTEQIKLISLVGITTLFVGFSEELMFRGIVLHAFLKTHNKTVAVIISSISFSLLHSVNMFGGLDVYQMMMQLVLTLLFGLFFALILLRIKSIIPLMIFHWLWDFSIIGGSVISPANEVANFASVNFIIEIVLVIALFIYLQVVKKNDNRVIA